MNHARPRVTCSNVIASIALFTALGGGAYAAATVGPEDIEEGAVRGKHIASNAVGPKKVANLRFRELELIEGSETIPGRRAPAFAVDAQGVVHLRGEIQNRTCDALICRAFELPARIRPPTLSDFLTADFGGSGKLVLSPGGIATILPCLPEGGEGGDACARTSLEGITYTP